MGSRYVFTPFHYILCRKDRSVEQTWLFLNCRLISSIEYRLYLCSHSIIIHLQQFKLTYIIRCFLSNEGQAWCSGESCLTESPGCGFEAASPQILRGEGLPRFFPSPDPHSCGSLRHWVCPFSFK